MKLVSTAPITTGGQRDREVTPFVPASPHSTHSGQPRLAIRFPIRGSAAVIPNEHPPMAPDCVHGNKPSSFAYCYKSNGKNYRNYREFLRRVVCQMHLSIDLILTFSQPTKRKRLRFVDFSLSWWMCFEDSWKIKRRWKVERRYFGWFLSFANQKPDTLYIWKILRVSFPLRCGRIRNVSDDAISSFLDCGMIFVKEIRWVLSNNK